MEGQLGFRKKYKMTGTPGNALATGKGTRDINSGPSGSKLAPKNEYAKKANVHSNGLKSKQAW